MARPDKSWLLADEWFAQFIADLQESPRRRRMLWREGRVPIPIKDQLARDYADKTRELEKYLAAERAREGKAA